MVTAWTVYLSLWLPIPLVSVILLTTFGRWDFVVRACRSVNGMKMGVVSLRALCFAVSLFVLVSTTRSSIDAKTLVANIPIDASANARIQIMSKKWRSERNFWISALVVVLWYVLGGLLRLREQNAKLRIRLTEVKELAEQEIPKETKKDKWVTTICTDKGERNRDNDERFSKNIDCYNWNEILLNNNETKSMS